MQKYEKCNTEVHGRGGLELMKLARGGIQLSKALRVPEKRP